MGLNAFTVGSVQVTATVNLANSPNSTKDFIFNVAIRSLCESPSHTISTVAPINDMEVLYGEGNGSLVSQTFELTSSLTKQNCGDFSCEISPASF